MIELPNALWLRSPKQPQYALCFDPSNSFFLWKMIENEAYNTWTSVAALSPRELARILELSDPLLDPYRPAVKARLQQLSEATSS